MVSIAQKLSTIEKWQKNKIVCFGEEITGTKITNPKTVLGSSLGEDVKFRNDDDDDNFSIIFNDTYQMIRTMISLCSIKTDKECKNLSNFPTVTL
jgi:hypothetical protein